MALSYCAALVREHDRDRYLCTLFAPACVREAWFALFAFNFEIAVIGETVSEEMLGFIRFAWWRETLDAIYAGGPVREHPVAQGLAASVREGALPRAPFDAMIDARANALEASEPYDAEALEEYCVATSSSLLHLCAASAAVPYSAALRSLGVAWALTGLMRAGKQHSSPSLIEQAQRRLDEAEAGGLGVFAPFALTCRFYLERLRAGRAESRGMRLRLLFKLWRELR